MNHKRKRPKQSRAGCLLCKPYKLNAHKSAKRAKDKRDALRHEAAAG